MAAEIITKEDLQQFRVQLLEELKDFFCQMKKDTPGASVKGYKTKHVRKILGCSANKLQALRVSGKLPYKKVGGTLYYKAEDIKKLLNDGISEMNYDVGYRNKMVLKNNC